MKLAVFGVQVAVILIDFLTAEHAEATKIERKSEYRVIGMEDIRQSEYQTRATQRDFVEQCWITFDFNL